MLKRFAGNQPKSVNIKRAQRKLRVEKLEDRRVFAGLLFDSLLVVKSDTASVNATAHAVDVDGNFFIGGNFFGQFDFDRNATHAGDADVLTSRGDSDGYIAKFNSSNQLLWVKQMGGTGSDNVADLTVDNSGNVFLGVTFASVAEFGASTLVSAGGQDVAAAKLDGNGNFLWANSWGTDRNEGMRETAVDQSGNFTVLDYTNDNSVSPAVARYEVRQFNLNGNLTWNAPFTSGNSNSTKLENIVTDAQGSLYISGSFSGTVDLDPGPSELLVTGSTIISNTFFANAFLIKLASDGSLQWADPFIASPSQKIAIGDVALAENGNIAIVGTYTGTVDIDPSSSSQNLLPDGVNSFFAEIGSTGAITAATSHLGYFRPTSMVATQGKYYVAGSLYGEETFNPSSSISVSGYGTVAGNNVASFTSVIVEMDSSGTVLDAGRIGGSSSPNYTSAIIAYDITADGAGGVYVGGWSNHYSTDFDPNPVRDFTVANSYPRTAYAFRLKLKIPAPTKFFVVNDASTDKTYEYTSSGSAIENYSLASGNTTPRGAASRVAGDKLWVADANRKVYSYNDSGAPLGSWTAGTLATNAIVEGLATNGTDVWIVDNKADRVYRYSNAAGRTAGSQNSVSSFALNGSNTNPKDIVTDGTHLWVVNDSTTDKVFKYTLAGSLVGSWTIDSANKSPTGITLDPSGISQSLWIVDSGTDRVYEYANARGNNGGSQAASVIFALASGNTNPQGIADPPPAGSHLISAASSPVNNPTLPSHHPIAPIPSLPTSVGTNVNGPSRFVTHAGIEDLQNRLPNQWSPVEHGVSALAITQAKTSFAEFSRSRSAIDHDAVLSNENFGELDESLLECLAFAR